MKALFVNPKGKSFEKYLGVRNTIKNHVEKLIMGGKEGTHMWGKSA